MFGLIEYGYFRIALESFCRHLSLRASDLAESRRRLRRVLDGALFKNPLPFLV